MPRRLPGEEPNCCLHISVYNLYDYDYNTDEENEYPYRVRVICRGKIDETRHTDKDAAEQYAMKAAQRLLALPEPE